MYQAIFSKRADQAVQDLSQRDALRIKEAIEKLQQDPRMRGVIKLAHAPVAEYRYRVGNLRILYDVDDAKALVLVLDIRKRDERTYR